MHKCSLLAVLMNLQTFGLVAFQEHNHNPVFPFSLLSTVGAWCCCWWYCLYSLLLAVQAVHTEVDQETAHSHDQPQRLPLHQSTGVHVH